MPTLDSQKMSISTNSYVGAVLRGKYRIDRILGVGGMAVVYEATHSNSRRFALKILRPEFSVQEIVRTRFIREGYIANSVGHPDVVAIIDDDVDEKGCPFLVMELLKGMSCGVLATPAAAPNPVREALGIICRVLDVLEAAHAKGIVHRDIKPENVFVTEDGVVKVLDFGIAKLHETAYDATQTGIRMGTPAFMAPEQAMAKTREVDARTDIWSVGATLFAMLSGQFVNDAENAAQMHIKRAVEPARSLGDVAPGLDPAVVEITMKALSFDKDSRYESAATMRDAIQSVLNTVYGGCSKEHLRSLVKSSRGLSATQDAKLSCDTSRYNDTSDVETAASEADTPLTETPPNSPSETTFRFTRSDEPPAKRRLPRNAASIVFMIAVLAVGAITIYSAIYRRGDIIVAATTDMSVPGDLDLLSWRVVTSKSNMPLQNGNVVLSDSKMLPIHLATITPTSDDAPLHIYVEGRRGGTNGLLLTKSDAIVPFPEEGSKTVVLHLDWLCAGHREETSCPTNQTCYAGACVDANLAASAESGDHSKECFDTARCFASGTWMYVPTIDVKSGDCTLPAHRMESIKNVIGQINIALVVNTAATGPYGVCGPSGKCLIPMDFGTARGWLRFSDGSGSSGILFPLSVCKNIESGMLRGVAVTSGYQGCPSKSEFQPLCAAPDNCIVDEDQCPSGMPEFWTGYTCTGASSPIEQDARLVWCWPTSTGANADRISRGGRWCCSKGEPPSEDPLLIDDMSGGPQIMKKAPSGYIPGFWWVGSNAINPQFSPPPVPGLFSYRSFEPEVPVGDGKFIRKAACLQSPGYSGTIAMEGFDLIAKKGDPTVAPMDVSGFSGISFYAYSPMGDQKLKVAFADQNTFTEDGQSTCNRHPELGKCGDDFSIQELTVSSEWKQYFVKWEDLKQSEEDWGQARFPSIDKTHVYAGYFGVKGLGPKAVTPPFNFCIADLRFTK